MQCRQFLIKLTAVGHKNCDVFPTCKMFFLQCILCIGDASHFFLPSVKNKAHKTKTNKKQEQQTCKTKNAMPVRKENTRIGQMLLPAY